MEHEPASALPADARVIWEAWPGFQTNALKAAAGEVFIGGSKGCAKTDALVAKPLYQVGKARYKALFLRHSYPELQEVIDRMHKIYLAFPAAQRPAWSGEDHRWNWPSGAKIRVGYCHKRGHVQLYQGQEWADILYDEMGNLADEGVIDLLLSEQRCPDPTVKRQLIGSGNPGFAGHPWIKKRFILPCGRDGAKIHWQRMDVPKLGVEWVSRQFVPGRVTDNPVYANDRRYMARLYALPERMRRLLMEGDWDAATGVAFDELDPAAHIVRPFEVPDHWPYVAAFDWGFSHWAVFMWGRVSEDGRVYVCDTINVRLMRDWDLAAMINERVPAQALRIVQAGHDLWDTSEGRGETIPTRAQYFHAQGINVTQANIRRAQGYANLMQYMAWKETPYLPERQPMVQFFDTPGNRWLIEEHLPTLIVNPDDPRDVLKVNADPETGEGGDDGYDCFRYLLASRPMKAESQSKLLRLSAWDDDVLRREAEKFWRPQDQPADKKAFRRGIYLGV